MAQISRGWADRKNASTGHVVDDPQCTLWRGDFSGVRLNAVCPKCHDPQPERFEAEAPGGRPAWLEWLVLLVIAFTTYVGVLWVWWTLGDTWALVASGTAAMLVVWLTARRMR